MLSAAKKGIRLLASCRCGKVAEDASVAGRSVRTRSSRRRWERKASRMILRGCGVPFASSGVSRTLVLEEWRDMARICRPQGVHVKGG